MMSGEQYRPAYDSENDSDTEKEAAGDKESFALDGKSGLGFLAIWLKSIKADLPAPNGGKQASIYASYLVQACKALVAVDINNRRVYTLQGGWRAGKAADFLHRPSGKWLWDYAKRGVLPTLQEIIACQILWFIWDPTAFWEPLRTKLKCPSCGSILECSGWMKLPRKVLTASGFELLYSRYYRCTKCRAGTRSQEFELFLQLWRHLIQLWRHLIS